MRAETLRAIGSEQTYVGPGVDEERRRISIHRCANEKVIFRPARHLDDAITGGRVRLDRRRRSGGEREQRQKSKEARGEHDPKLIPLTFSAKTDPSPRIDLSVTKRS